jgi:hypothetical protein
MSPSSGGSKPTLAVYETVVEVAMIAVLGGLQLGGRFGVCDQLNRPEPCCCRKKEKNGGEFEALIWRAAAAAEATELLA